MDCTALLSASQTNVGSKGAISTHLLLTKADLGQDIAAHRAVLGPDAGISGSGQA